MNLIKYIISRGVNGAITKRIGIMLTDPFKKSAIRIRSKSMDIVIICEIVLARQLSNSGNILFKYQYYMLSQSDPNLFSKYVKIK